MWKCPHFTVYNGKLIALGGGGSEERMLTAVEVYALRNAQMADTELRVLVCL